MAQTELVSMQLQQAVYDQLEIDRSTRRLLQPWIEAVGGIAVLVTMFYELAIAVKNDDEEHINEQHELLSSNPDVAAMFEHSVWQGGKLSAAFLGMIIRAVQLLESSEPAPLIPESET